MSNNFWYKPFLVVPGNLGGIVPAVDNILSSHEQEIYSTTSLDENCIEFEFQTDRNYYVDSRLFYLALKLKFVKGCFSKSYNSREVKEEHKEEARIDDEIPHKEELEGAPVLLVTHVNIILDSIFSNVEVDINNQQIYNSNGLYAQKSYISNNFKAAISEHRGVLHCKGYD